MLPGTSVLISEQYPRHYRRPCRRCIVGIWEPSETDESNKLSNQRQNLLFYPRRNIQGIQWAFYHSDNIIDNTINTEPDLTSLVDFVNRKKAGNSADFSIPLISEREVLENIKPLPSNVATGLDGISSPLLKLIAPAVAPSLAKVINCSIINSICPAQLKLARVTPIRFTNRGVKPILTITDLYQSSLSFRRFSRNMSANTSLLFSLITIYCTNANRVLELTTPAKPSLSKLQMNG